MPSLPTIGFDTSVVNELENTGNDAEPLMCALAVGYHIRIVATNIDEVIAHRDPVKREALVARCVRLLASGECLWPHHWIVRLLIRRYRANPNSFDWRQVDVRAKPFEQALIRRNYTEQVCAEQRLHQFAMEKKNAKDWNALRPKLAPILAKVKRSQRPTTFMHAARIAERNGSVLCSIGARLYELETGVLPSDDDVRAFMDVCPPFRAVCYSGVGTWFDRAIRPTHTKKPVIGRNDSMMATYLPYCDRFVARDWPLVQRFRDIAEVANLNCEVLSYEEFSRSFTVVI